MSNGLSFYLLAYLYLLYKQGAFMYIIVLKTQVNILSNVTASDKAKIF